MISKKRTPERMRSSGRRNTPERAATPRGTPAAQSRGIVSPRGSLGNQGRASTPVRSGTPRGSISPSGRRSRRLGMSNSWHTAGSQDSHERSTGSSRGVKSGVERQASARERPGSPRQFRSSLGRMGASTGGITQGNSAARGVSTVLSQGTSRSSQQQSHTHGWGINPSSSPRAATPRAATPPQDRPSVTTTAPRGQHSPRTSVSGTNGLPMRRGLQPTSSPTLSTRSPRTSTASGLEKPSARTSFLSPRGSPSLGTRSTRSSVPAVDAAPGVKRRTSTASSAAKGLGQRDKFQPPSRMRPSAAVPSGPSTSDRATPASSSSAPSIPAQRSSLRQTENSRTVQKPSPKQVPRLRLPTNGSSGTSPQSHAAAQKQPDLPKCPSSSVVDSGSTSLELQASAFTCAGRRLIHGEHSEPDWANQDAYLVVPAHRDRMFLAVLDGHGEHGRQVAGSVCAIFEQMAPGLLGLPQAGLGYALAQVFLIAQAALERNELARFSGTTATIAIIDVAAATVTTAHVGDSRLMIIGPDAEHHFETRVHRVVEESPFGLKSEKRMSEKLGITADMRARQASEPAVNLSISRSLGDLEAHNLGILADPTIEWDVPFTPGMTLVAASNGVWQKLPRSTVASMVGLTRDADSARRIVTEARSKWPARGEADDITAVVVRSSNVHGASNYQGVKVAAAGA